MADIEARVKSIVKDELGVDDEKEVTLDSSFTQDLGADSLDLIELNLALEEHFGISIPDEEGQMCHTVRDATNYITSHVSPDS